MNSLTPIFVKNIMTYTGGISSNEGNGGHYWILTTGVNSSNLSTTVPVNGIHGPIDISHNGGADVLELVGAVQLGTTGGTTCTACATTISAWGETHGMAEYKRILGVSGTTSFTGALTLANHGKEIGGFSSLTVSAGQTNTSSRGTSTRGGVFGQSVGEGWPMIADDTQPTSGDKNWFSAFITGPGGDSSGSAFEGGAISLAAFSRIWLAIKFIPTVTVSIVAPVWTGGLALVGYRASKRKSPTEHKIVGLKPFGPTTMEFL